MHAQAFRRGGAGEAAITAPLLRRTHPQSWFFSSTDVSRRAIAIHVESRLYSFTLDGKSEAHEPQTAFSTRIDGPRVQGASTCCRRSSATWDVYLNQLWLNGRSVKTPLEALASCVNRSTSALNLRASQLGPRCVSARVDSLFLVTA